VPPERFAAWRGEQQAAATAAAAAATKTWTLADLVAEGKKVYTANCVACHQDNGAGIPGTFPALDRSPLATGDKAAHLNIVFNGKPGTAMAAFGKQLSDVEIAAVVTYERNSWSNKTGDAVQPADVAALRR
jgi:cytochrome c oxidase subunit 2